MNAIVLCITLFLAPKILGSSVSVNDYVRDCYHQGLPLDYEKLFSLEGTLSSGNTALVLSYYTGSDENCKFVKRLHDAGCILLRRELETLYIEANSVETLSCIHQTYGNVLPIHKYRPSILSLYFKSRQDPVGFSRNLHYLIQNGLPLPKLFSLFFKMLGHTLPVHETRYTNKIDEEEMRVLLRSQKISCTPEFIDAALNSCIRASKVESYGYINDEEGVLLSKIQKRYTHYFLIKPDYVRTALKSGLEANMVAAWNAAKYIDDTIEFLRVFEDQDIDESLPVVQDIFRTTIQRMSRHEQKDFRDKVADASFTRPTFLMILLEEWPGFFGNLKNLRISFASASIENFEGPDLYLAMMISAIGSLLRGPFLVIDIFKS